MTSYTQHLEAVQTVTNFFGQLALRYSGEDFAMLSNSLSDMRERWGDIYLAAAIEKDPKDAELALFRYGRFKARQQEQNEAQAIAASKPEETAWIHLNPETPGERRRKKIKKIAAMTLCTVVGAIVITTCIVMLWRTAKHDEQGNESRRLEKRNMQIDTEYQEAVKEDDTGRLLWME